MNQKYNAWEIVCIFVNKPNRNLTNINSITTENLNCTTIHSDGWILYVAGNEMNHGRWGIETGYFYFYFIQRPEKELFCDKFFFLSQFINPKKIAPFFIHVWWPCAHHFCLQAHVSPQHPLDCLHSGKRYTSHYNSNIFCTLTLYQQIMFSPEAGGEFINKNMFRPSFLSRYPIVHSC
jgi:hypothetical protein